MPDSPLACCVCDARSPTAPKTLGGRAYPLCSKCLAELDGDEGVTGALEGLAELWTASGAPGRLVVLRVLGALEKLSEASEMAPSATPPVTPPPSEELDPATLAGARALLFTRVAEQRARVATRPKRRGTR